ncbi:hypothetical protein MtrunA17_Chr3g0097171 [Medicago truncatula]|uniref:Uncharacterized protein n=1 Tax=Medicago truncatula TaxID=3880 RepID=A0A396IQF4_MEDTR|nr:hypothetical protein MtrunA17_Chr3g0097171 [Medicago truncatula]
MFQEDAAKVKLQNSVINSPGEIAVHNFLKSCAKQKILNHLAKKSKPGPDEGTANLKVNTNDENIAKNMHKRKEVCPIENTRGEVAVQNILKSCAKQEKSKQPVKKCKSLSKVSFSDDNLIQFDKGDTTKVHFSPDVELSRPLSAFQEEGINSINTEVVKSESSQPSATDRDASSRTYKAPNEDMIGKSCSLLEEEKKGVGNYNMEHNFNGLSLNSSGKLIKFGLSGKVEMKHQGGSQLQISTVNMIQPVKVHSNETLQNQSLGVSGNAISNIPEHIIARTNPKGIISRPKLRNSKMNDRKRIHRGTSSASGIPFSSPPRTSRMFSPAHQGPTWSHDFPNTNVCPVQVSQPTHIPTTHVPNPPSATNRNITKAAAKVTHIPVTRAFSNSRTRPNKFPEVEKQENLTQMNVDQDSSATDSDRDLQGNTREVDSLDPNGMPKHSENVDQDSSATDSDRDFEDQKKLTKPSKQSVRLILFFNSKFVLLYNNIVHISGLCLSAYWKYVR